ncbi:helix-turn-helix domain-containing protein [Rudanella paleaurantiibacter]|uniref:Helix-turn-helix domain-containing protein n=1 Tax=Rudanella paleaurantiibacter TaxID=2614655 RepID=A0A7J5TYQ8_9BACT|nr:AraC family transcriptional regulator [Rudanella paleaurantiibacter]KAB7730278.1 helix-turn-helix domain-containing protein [Rudanella paleaurantiibacter]
MKQALRKDLEPVAESFAVHELTEPHFDPNWHFHPHYQLFLVEKGTGTRFIGDSIRPFAEGDFVMLGPNLPHLWRSDKPYFERDSGLQTHGIVVYFTENFLGDTFFAQREMGLLRQLLENARRGLEWLSPTRDRAIELLRRVQQTEPGFERVLALLNLLHELSRTSDYQFITSLGYTNTVKPSETDRIQVVHDYVMSHFHDHICLDTVADLAGMTPSAFCRYFKMRANKTFSNFVAEVRVGHACKLLMDGSMSVTQISYESGYRTLSNFNRQFKEVTGKTPSTYVRTYRAL